MFVGKCSWGLARQSHSLRPILYMDIHFQWSLLISCKGELSFLGRERARYVNISMNGVLSVIVVVKF